MKRKLVFVVFLVLLVMIFKEVFYLGVSKTYSVLFDGQCVYSGSIRSCRLVYDSVSFVLSSLKVTNHALLLVFGKV